MSTKSLTAKYRPQRFSEVAGQDAVKAVLSRAAAEDRIAPAYLFSGTRGVGKTTIARILAKAVNCERGPAAEPCNECRHCRAITAGAAVDVVEIDAASNRGIDDARRLKEDIGYAPIECRYKVFIVDEAHMLTREAFNALLKTLEEPPPHATFVLATTEPHKFPATIISRCQHYTFKRLPQKELEAHLRSLLEREGVGFEPQALSLIARRGAGSVRDSMSLLAQALAMGSEPLTAADVRAVLGLAGREVLLRLLDAVAAGDCAALSALLSEVLDQGLDLGFFLRELAGTWRDLFLLSQSGGTASGAIEASPEEVAELTDYAGRFTLAHIHACWQLTLEGQRRVLHSLEPAQALELLLFNMASLPKLLDLESPAAARGARPGPVGRGPQGGGNVGSGGQRPVGPAQSGQGGAGQGLAPQAARQPAAQAMARPEAGAREHAPAAGAGPAAGSESAASESAPQPEPEPPSAAASVAPASGRAQEPEPEPVPVPDRAPWEDPEDVAADASADVSADVSGEDFGPEPTPEAVAEAAAPTPAQPEPAPSAPASAPAPRSGGPRTWEGFLAFAQGRANGQGLPAGFSLCKGEYAEGVLRLVCQNDEHRNVLSRSGNLERIERLVREYFGEGTETAFACAARAPEKSRKELRDDLRTNPVVRKMIDDFGAIIVNFDPIN